MSFPSKEEREKCWASRDEFWKCLDEHGGSQEICSKFRQLYENTCPPQWVKHFDRKREYLKFKDRIQKEGSRNTAAALITSNDGVGFGEEEGLGVGMNAAGGCPRLICAAAVEDASRGSRIQDLEALTATTMISCRRRRRADEDAEVVLNVSASGISVQIPRCSASNDRDEKLSVSRHHCHASEEDGRQLTSFSSTNSNTTGSSSSSTKVPSPRIYRRWQAFQPPTFS